MAAEEDQHFLSPEDATKLLREHIDQKKHWVSVDEIKFLLFSGAHPNTEGERRRHNFLQMMCWACLYRDVSSNAVCDMVRVFVQNPNFQVNRRSPGKRCHLACGLLLLRFVVFCY